MNQAHNSAPLFAFTDPDDYRRLRDLLAAAGFLDESVLDAIGVSDLPSLENDHPLLLDRTAGGSVLHTLIRLFLMEMPVEADIFARAIHPMATDSWQQAGLVRRHGSRVTAALKLLPFRNLILAFDLPAMLQTPQRSRYVMGIGGSTITLSQLTVRRPCRQTLDLGCGCGVHAFLAAPHSSRVAAVDLNPRAVRLAAFNARLNSISNVDCLEGDFFGPVGERKFDLIISNPPFVISPETRFIYRDAGMEADSVSRRIAREAPGFLEEGGFCQILCNWAQKGGSDWQQQLAQWFAGTGCDVWVMRSESLTPAAYASKWIRHTEFGDQETEFSQRFHHWLEYYERLGIASFGAGLITMRRRASGANWFRADASPDRMLGPCGEYIARGFALQDFLETVNEDRALLACRLKFSPDLRLEQQFTPSEQGWQVTGSSIQLARGLAFRGNSDTFMANLMIHCDGRKTLQELLPDMAAALQAEPAQLAPLVCRLIRKLVGQGFLLPTGQGNGS
ncbi:MAG: class I SAM-dependent methyltransferase [Desulfobulbaceae bacterium]|nr:class I SAM-dependent methyltransferase [Desulfobulbaceae bacterium]